MGKQGSGQFQTLNEIMAEAEKTYKESIMTYGLKAFDQCTKIPFTSPRMNYCTHGGIPVGRLVEFFGVEHGGKTTSALDIAANFQEMERAKAESDPTYVERKVLYVDCENTLDAIWATKLNVDIDDLVMMNPTTQSAEEIMNIVIKAINSGEVGLFVIDSLGAMLSQQALDKDLTEVTYAGISKPLTTFSIKAEMLCKKYKCTGIGINQLRDDMNSSWGGTKTPGGRGWRHMCDTRLQFSKGSYIDEDGKELTRGADSPVGNQVLVRVEKMKSAPSTRRNGYYTLRYDIGVDYLADLIDVAIKCNIIIKSGAWYQLAKKGEPFKNKVQGEDKIYAMLLEDKEARQIIEEQVNEAILLPN